MRVLTADEAAAIVPDGATIAMLGQGGAQVEPRAVYRALGERYAATGSPARLTLIHSGGIGNHDAEGLSRFAQPGMTKRVMGGHWAWSPQMQKLALDGEIEAYNMPQGVVCQQYREIAAGRPGLITRIGLGTFIDPRLEGARLNERTTEDLIEVVTLGGVEYLHYKPWRIDVGIIRATTADMDGNLVFTDEVAFLEARAIAAAAHNCGGLVIAQVKQLAERGSLDPQLVQVPGILVDVVVVDPGQKQTSQGDDDALSGRIRRPAAAFVAMPLDQRKVIARRAAMELRAGLVINLGVGIPAGVASVAHEEGLAGFTSTIEQGLVGGVPSHGDLFGSAANPQAFVPAPDQFDFYAGGGLDLACLGMAQLDAHGNVNVSRFGPMIAGCGGFVDISQSAREVVFCGTFTAGGLRTAVGDGRLEICQEGRVGKLVEQVEQITFSGAQAIATGQKVTYVTERAVFRLDAEGLVLTEVAPGIDLQRQVLDLMDFAPRIADDLRVMDERIFRDQLMGLRTIPEQGDQR